MPLKKNKYNSRFPPARIKKIMQTDEEVGKMSAAVPVIISRGLELFVESLLMRAGEVTAARHARTLTPAHLKQCIMAEKRFDFLQELVASVPDIGPEGEWDPSTPLTPIPPSTPTTETTPPQLLQSTPPPPSLQLLPHSQPQHPVTPPQHINDSDAGQELPWQQGRGMGRSVGRGRGRGRGRGAPQSGQQQPTKVPRPRGRPRKVPAPPISEPLEQPDSDDALSLDVDTDEDMASETDEEVIMVAEHSVNSCPSSTTHKPLSPNPASSCSPSSSSSSCSSSVSAPQASKAPPPAPSLPAPTSALQVPTSFGVPEVSTKVGAFQISIGKEYTIGLPTSTTSDTTTVTTISSTTTTATTTTTTTTTTLTNNNNSAKVPPKPIPKLHPIRMAIPHLQGLPRVAGPHSTTAAMPTTPHSPMTPGTRPFFGVPVPVITSVHAANSRPALPGDKSAFITTTTATTATPLSQVDEDYDS